MQASFKEKSIDIATHRQNVPQVIYTEYVISNKIDLAVISAVENRRNGLQVFI